MARPEYVMKEYNGNYAERYYETEVSAFKHIIDAKVDEYFVHFFTGLQHSNERSIIMEYADIGTLDHFFEQAQDQRPSSPDEIKLMWTNFCGILFGIYGLHQPLPDMEQESSVARG
jgi:hypothetical protein